MQQSGESFHEPENIVGYCDDCWHWKRSVCEFAEAPEPCRAFVSKRIINPYARKSLWRRLKEFVWGIIP